MPRSTVVAARYEKREADGALVGTIEVFDDGHAEMSEWFKGERDNGNRAEFLYFRNLGMAKRYWPIWCNGSGRAPAPWRRLP